MVGAVNYDQSSLLIKYFSTYLFMFIKNLCEKNLGKKES